MVNKRTIQNPLINEINEKTNELLKLKEP
jgi:hypothetical protein